ncbi:MAG: hypothetical protein M1820_005489 [Bogoriella megaspora]|nr:MAG: hypothetical protein M1820_005489 [Bogoriella megaspora]
MTTPSSYLAYKRDTRYLVYWMIQTSNAITKSPSATEKDGMLPPNTTGQAKVSDLLPMSESIARHLKSIPAIIYRLFRSVINARSEAYAMFQQIVADDPDPEMKKSNDSHKYFIDCLKRAFEALGGHAWESSQQKQAGTAQEKDDIEEVLFANKFASLALNGFQHDDEEGEEPGNDLQDHITQQAADSQIRQQSKPSASKKKKNKRGNNAKRKHKTTPVDTQPTKEVPLESYRIIEDKDGISTEYLMAVQALLTEWVGLRRYVQGLWRDVAYSGLNSAVAGAVSNVAIATIRQTETSIFVDFPDHDTYETILQTITRGDAAKAQSYFTLSLRRIVPNSEKIETVFSMNPDIQELFSMHTYRDLLDFVTDFQKTRSGKPTKRMLSEIGRWDPYLDLQRATEDQRMKWRRSYTINWLYDLVNLFSSIVVQYNNVKGEHHAYEKVDWSVNGPWNRHRRLFGLNEFAGVVTSLAMQKAGTNVQHKIFPHHVFQLQCIVDSLTVSRGWSQSILRGHVLKSPAAAFRPRRDVDLFLDRDNLKVGTGYLQGVVVLKRMLELDATARGDPNRHETHSELLNLTFEDFRDWLAESKYAHPLASIPPSRFSNTNSNGLWEFSPFLCGVGLMEGLEIAYDAGMMLWDSIPEPYLLVHLHNMLTEKGYITQPVELYHIFAHAFAGSFFADGNVPTSDFRKAFLARTFETGSRGAKSQRRYLRLRAVRSGADFHDLLNPKLNRFFKSRSILSLLRGTGWRPDRIPENGCDPASGLGMLRIAQTNQIVDPLTGERRLEDTELVKRARDLGIEESVLLEASSNLRWLSPKSSGEDVSSPLNQSQLASLGGESYTTKPNLSYGSPTTESIKRPGISRHRRDKREIPTEDLLTLVKCDLTGDVHGGLPLCGINYIWITNMFLKLFGQIEDELRRVRNPLWVRAYEDDANTTPGRDKRVSLAFLAMLEEEDECLKIMAREFQNPRMVIINHVYWGSIVDKLPGPDETSIDDDVPSCTVM